MHCGCSQTVFHKQETVEEMMNQKSNEKTAATTGTVGKPPMILLLQNVKMRTKKGVHETRCLEVLEMPCGEHDDASIAMNFHSTLVQCKKKKGMEGMPLPESEVVCDGRNL